MVFIFFWARSHCEFNLRAFSPPIFRESLAYGVPLVFSEISFISLAFADRLMLLPLLGNSYAKVAVYNYGYDLAMYIGDFLAYSLIPAFQPVANRIYETEGRQAALALQRQVLRGLYYAAAAIGVGLMFVGPDLLLLIAGEDKTSSGPIFKWIGINYALYPIFIIMAYGLNLAKKTRIISVIVFSAALLNIAQFLVDTPAGYHGRRLGHTRLLLPDGRAANGLLSG